MDSQLICVLRASPWPDGRFWLADIGSVADHLAVGTQAQAAGLGVTATKHAFLQALSSF